jgi:hypothetical protein
VKRNPSRCTAGTGPGLAGGLLPLRVLGATA